MSLLFFRNVTPLALTTLVGMTLVTISSSQAAAQASIQAATMIANNNDARPEIIQDTLSDDVSFNSSTNKNNKDKNSKDKPSTSDAKLALSVNSIDMFAQCATVQTDAARLACYDKVAHAGEVSVAEVKKPLDLAKSVQVSLQSLKPQVVMVSEDDRLSANDGLAAQVSIQDSLQQDNSQDTAQANRTVSDIGFLPVADEAQVLAKVGVTADDIGRYTPLSLAYDLDKNSELGVWSARPYNPMYLLPIYYTFDPNRHPSTPTQEQVDYNSDEVRNLELKAQLSLKSKVMEDLFDTNADLWFGYTQQMHWQVYNENNSRPFRATDYKPEIFLTQPVKAELPFNGRLRMLGVGAMHHSNGQSDPLSRSWNRIYLMGGMEWGNVSVIPRVWAHVKGSDSSKPSDNPDMTDYYGYGDIKVLYDFGHGRAVSGIGRYNFGQNHGALQLDYIHPITEDVQGFVQLFHGYGESIIDYNKQSTSIGLGVSLNDWKGL